MSVPDQPTIFPYTGNGITTTFPYGCYLLSEDDLVVTVNGSEVTMGFTVTGIGDQAGGSVIFSVAPADEIPVVLYRQVAVERDSDYQRNGDLRADTLNKDFDRLWMAMQDGLRDKTSSLRYPLVENLDGELPPAGARKGMIHAYDSVVGRHMMVPMPASVGAGDMVIDTFTAGVDFTPGVTTQLTLSREPGSPANLEIFFDPLFQGPDQWSVLGTSLTFNDPIPGSTTKVFARIGTTLSILIPPPGSVKAKDVMYQAPYVGATVRSQHDKNLERDTPFDYASPSQILDIISRAETMDHTGPVLAALLRPNPYFPSGTYCVTVPLPGMSNQRIDLGGGVIIKQKTANTLMFSATQKDNFWVHGPGATLYGEGAWSAGWTGNGGHNDIGVKLLGCTRSGVHGVNFKNFAASAILLQGGQRLRVTNFGIEGTNEYSTPLPFGSNFQNGIYLRDDPTYGPCDDLVVTGGDISGTAQGILRENFGSVANLGMSFSGLNIHDIPGQHGFYLQTGAVAIAGVALTNIAGSGVKFQSADANQAINGCSAIGITGRVLGVSLFEINCTGTGSTNDVTLQGSADQAVVGLATSGAVRDLRCDMELTNVGSSAVLIQGNGPKDFDITVTAQTVGDDGILVAATNATGIRFHNPRLRECNNNNTVGTGISGIRVASASAQVELFNPESTDVNTRQQYGLFNSVAGSTVKVRGSATFTGASDTAVRATGLIDEWPTETSLGGSNGAFTSMQNVRSSQPMLMTVSTNSASNSVLWARDLLAGQTYKIVAELSFMRGDNSDRKSVRSTALVYMNAGVAVIEGSPVETEAIASAGVAGVYSWAVTGSQIQLLVNSGAVTTYRWKARVSVTQSGL